MDNENKHDESPHFSARHNMWPFELILATLTKELSRKAINPTKRQQTFALISKDYETFKVKLQNC